MWNNVKYIRPKGFNQMVLIGIHLFAPKTFCSGLWRVRPTFSNYRSSAHNTDRSVQKELRTERPWKVLFFGTDEFAVESLKILYASRYCAVKCFMRLLSVVEHFNCQLLFTSKIILQMLNHFQEMHVQNCTSPAKLEVSYVWFISLCSCTCSCYRQESCDRIVESLEVVTFDKDLPVRRFANANKLVVHDWPHVNPQGRFDVGVVVSFGCLLREGLICQFP